MELLIVVALIMILSMVGIGAYTSATVKSRDTQRKNDLNQLAKAVEAFYNDAGRYPLTSTGKPQCYEKSGTTVTNVACTGKLYTTIDGNTTNYINIPEDPDADQDYIYESSATGTTFAYFTALESTTDRDLFKNVDGSVNLDPFGVACGSAQCNYKITEAGLVKSL